MHEADDSDALPDEIPGLRLERVNERRCRVVDEEALPARRLLGYIEQRDDCFEVFQVGADPSLHRFDSWARALQWVAATGPALADARSADGTEWRI